MKKFLFVKSKEQNKLMGMKKLLLLISFLFLLLQSRSQSINDSLLLYMPFNGNANDESGNNNNGTIHNNVTLTTDRNGNPNAAYNFDGINSYIEIPPSPSLEKIYTSNEITISAWINIRNWYQGWNVFPIFEQYDPTTDLGAIAFEANWASGGILFLSGYNVNYIGCDYSWNFNTWHQVAVTYSAPLGIVKFYVDGILTCTKPYSQNFTPDIIHSFTIGRSLSGPDEYSDGAIDELKIYNRVLTDIEITTLPLKLISFTGVYKNGGTYLHWKTTSEFNVSNFEIERSKDGRVFEKIGTVSINSGGDYSYNDIHTETGTSFYRLKIVDINGQYSYSNIIKISADNLNAFNVFPNPSKGRLILDGVQGNGIINLFSIEGKLIKELKTFPNMEIDISNFKNGPYLIQYINKNEVQSKLLIKQ